MVKFFFNLYFHELILISVTLSTYNKTFSSELKNYILHRWYLRTLTLQLMCSQDNLFLIIEWVGKPNSYNCASQYFRHVLLLRRVLTALTKLTWKSVFLMFHLYEFSRFISIPKQVSDADLNNVIWACQKYTHSRPAAHVWAVRGKLMHTRTCAWRRYVL